MKKNTLAIIMMIGMAIGNSITACAAPELMPDGKIFDAKAYLNY